MLFKYTIDSVICTAYNSPYKQGHSKMSSLKFSSQYKVFHFFLSLFFLFRKHSLNLNHSTCGLHLVAYV